MSDSFDFLSMFGGPEPASADGAPAPDLWGLGEPVAASGNTSPVPGFEALTGPPAASEASIAQTPSIAQIIGEHTTLNQLPYSLTKRQKNYSDIASKTIYISGGLPTGQSIWDMWPEGLLKSGVRPDITDPDDISRIARAGFRPQINDIQGYLESTEYSERMRELGIVVNTAATGLTAEQMGVLTLLSDYSDGKNLRQKLRNAGVPWAKYQAWLSQPVFSRYYNQIGGDALRTSMPIAKQQIASKVAAGDMSAIKLAMEMTGEYDPRGQKQVDAQALLRIVLEVLEEEVKDPRILTNIATKLTIRGQKEIGSPNNGN